MSPTAFSTPQHRPNVSSLSSSSESAHLSHLSDDILGLDWATLSPGMPLLDIAPFTPMRHDVDGIIPFFPWSPLTRQ